MKQVCITLYDPYCSIAGKAQIPLVVSHHDTSRHNKHDLSCKSWCDVMCHALLCMLRHVCSNMVDDDGAVELVRKTISCFIIINHFSSQMKLIRLLKQITAIITFCTLQTN